MKKLFITFLVSLAALCSFGQTVTSNKHSVITDQNTYIFNKPFFFNDSLTIAGVIKANGGLWLTGLGYTQAAIGHLSIDAQGKVYQDTTTYAVKRYVDSLHKSGGQTSAGNGLTLQSNKVLALGGKLDSATTINTGANNFVITTDPALGDYGLFAASPYDMQLSVRNDNLGSVVGVVADGVDGVLQLQASIGSNSDALYMYASGGATFIDNTSHAGITYGDDYEANFLPRSLITKQYADGLLHKAGADTSVSNNYLIKTALGNIYDQYHTWSKDQIFNNRIVIKSGENLTQDNNLSFVSADGINMSFFSPGNGEYLWLSSSKTGGILSFQGSNIYDWNAARRFLKQQDNVSELINDKGYLTTGQVGNDTSIVNNYLSKTALNNIYTQPHTWTQVQNFNDGINFQYNTTMTDGAAAFVIHSGQRGGVMIYGLNVDPVMSFNDNNNLADESGIRMFQQPYIDYSLLTGTTKDAVLVQDTASNDHGIIKKIPVSSFALVGQVGKDTSVVNNYANKTQLTNIYIQSHTWTKTQTFGDSIKAQYGIYGNLYGNFSTANAGSGHINGLGNFLYAVNQDGSAGSTAIVFGASLSLVNSNSSWSFENTSGNAIYSLSGDGFYNKINNRYFAYQGLVGKDTSIVNNYVSKTQLSTITQNQLIGWAYSNSYALTSVTRDSNNAIVTANVTWPDGSTGVYTTDTASSALPGAVDAYHVTYVPTSGTTKTLTQGLVTRNSSGAVTSQPAITIQ